MFNTLHTVCFMHGLAINEIKKDLPPCSVFWGELIDKYKDINANSETVFTDYAMLKLVHIVPIYF